MSEVRRLHVVITGRVQGVGFRYYVLRCARDRGLVGWVRNRPDGSVELVAEGDEPSLRGLLADLKQGPPLSWVQQVSTEWQSPQPGLQGFDIGPTAY